jgi:hypothetical protein
MDDDFRRSAGARSMMRGASADGFVNFIRGIITRGAERRN